jgi:hypothetical protein
VNACLQAEGWEDVRAGAVAEIQEGANVFKVKVVDADDKLVTIDANDPRAGQHLDFEVTVKEMTKADSVAKLTVGAGACWCLWRPVCPRVSMAGGMPAALFPVPSGCLSRPSLCLHIAPSDIRL